MPGDRLRERVERRLPLAFDAPPAQDRRAAPRGSGGELPQEPGLADTGFTDDGHQPAAPGRGRGRTVEQPAQLALPSYEGGMDGRRLAGNRHGEQRRIVAQDPRVQVVQVGPGRDAELAGQSRPAGTERVEGVCLAAVAVQRQHQLGPAPLTQRCTRHHVLQLAAHPSVSSRAEFEVDQVLACRLAQVVEPACLGLGEGPVGELAERRTPPQTDRGAQRRRGGVRVLACRGRPALRQEAFRAIRVDPAVSGLEPVAAGDRRDAQTRRLGERVPQSQDIVLQRVHRGTRPPLTVPQLVDEPVPADRPLPVHRQNGEQEALLGGAEHDRAARSGHLQLAEDAQLDTVLHRSSVAHRTCPRRCLCSLSRPRAVVRAGRQRTRSGSTTSSGHRRTLAASPASAGMLGGWISLGGRPGGRCASRGITCGASARRPGAHQPPMPSSSAPSGLVGTPDGVYRSPCKR